MRSAGCGSSASTAELTAVDLPSMRSQDYPTFFPGLQSGLDCRRIRRRALVGARADDRNPPVDPRSRARRTRRPVDRHRGRCARPARPRLGRPGDPRLRHRAEGRGHAFPSAHPALGARHGRQCTPLAIGADWIGIANLRTAVLSLYDWSGRDLGAMRLDGLVPGNRGLSTIGGAGHYLGVSSSSVVRTFEVHVDPACAAKETRVAVTRGCGASALRFPAPLTSDREPRGSNRRRPCRRLQQIPLSPCRSSCPCTTRRRRSASSCRGPRPCSSRWRGSRSCS